MLISKKIARILRRAVSDAEASKFTKKTGKVHPNHGVRLIRELEHKFTSEDIVRYVNSNSPNNHKIMICQSIQSNGDELSTALLCILSCDENYEVRYQAIESLSYTTSAKLLAERTLLNIFLSDDDCEIRSLSLRSLGSMNSVIAVDLIKEFLSQECLIQDIIFYIGEIKSMDHREIVIRSLSNESSRIRSEALSSLYKFGDVSNVPSIKLALEKEQDQLVAKRMTRVIEALSA